MNTPTQQAGRMVPLVVTDGDVQRAIWLLGRLSDRLTDSIERVEDEMRNAGSTPTTVPAELYCEHTAQVREFIEGVAAQLAPRLN